ncbi:MAG TPA: hypothetical protein VLJ11_13760 [Bryobacteraceae bacterium]|nr:hypothetical protein [Bryobacteraceae bacterium]
MARYQDQLLTGDQHHIRNAGKSWFHPLHREYPDVRLGQNGDQGEVDCKGKLLAIDDLLAVFGIRLSFQKLSTQLLLAVERHSYS